MCRCTYYMCICMHVHPHINTHTHTHIDVYSCICLCMYTHTHTRTHARTHARTHTPTETRSSGPESLRKSLGDFVFEKSQCPSIFNTVKCQVTINRSWKKNYTVTINRTWKKKLYRPSSQLFRSSEHTTSEPTSTRSLLMGVSMGVCSVS